jgi:ApaG protein
VASGEGERNSFSVKVRVVHLAEQSEPGRQVFVYFVSISNDGVNAGQLLDRHWLINDGGLPAQEVHGSDEGVIGKQPMIVPGETYEYNSFVVLREPPGVMRGWYDFRSDRGERFTVEIPEFTLAPPGAKRLLN